MGPSMQLHSGLRLGQEGGSVAYLKFTWSLDVQTCDLAVFDQH